MADSDFATAGLVESDTGSDGAESGTAFLPRASSSRYDFESMRPMPHPFKRPLQAIAWVLQAACGLACGLAVLAILAATPVLNLFALGYVLEVQGRVARSGKLRCAFFLLPAAQRLGGIALAIWLWLLPIQLLSGIVRDAWLLAPSSLAAWFWTALLIGVCLLVAAHLILALACGGGFWRFARPISNLRRTLDRYRQGILWRDAHQAISEFAASLRVVHHFRLGLIGFVAAYVWLALPTFLFTLLTDTSSGWQVACLLVGSATLVLVLMWLPFLQVRFAAEGRPAAMFELPSIRERFRHSPFCWLLAVAALFALSVVPLLYSALIKLRLPPHDARWDLMLVFLVTVITARVIVAWAYGRAGRRPRAWLIWQWINRLAICAGVGAYVYFLFLASTAGDLGQQSIWQHHAVLLPLPF